MEQSNWSARYAITANVEITTVTCQKSVEKTKKQAVF